MFKPPYKWAMSQDENHLLGVCQRVDTFDFVVNTDKSSRPTWAKDQGWDLFHDPGDGRTSYGILAYDNWNIMHYVPRPPGCIRSRRSPTTKSPSSRRVRAASGSTARWLITG